MKDFPKLLTIGVDPETLLLLESILKNTAVTSMEADLEKLMDPLEVTPAIILVSSPNMAFSLEIGQFLSGLYPAVPLFLICKSSEVFERKDFIKNGFKDAFLIPMDTSALRSSLNEAIVEAGSTEIKSYRSVKLLDLEAGETLDFDTNLFLPSNKKYVKISNAGDEIDSTRLESIKKHKINNLHVPSNQIQGFYEYSGKKLRKLNAEGGMSATERKEKLTSSVRELMSGMFSQQTSTFQTGSEVLKTCSGIVSAYIVQGAESEWFVRIKQVTGEFGDNYSHSSNVSTLAALFSMGTGIGKPEDLALAGLLHDMGKSQLSAEIQELEAEEMTPEQYELYKKHPEMSVNMIKQKKIVIPELVTKMILQHHEYFNGTGFPNGYFGTRICKEAQLVALADKFDHLTKLKPGKPLMSPLQAVKLLKDEQTNNPSKIKYDPEILKKLLTLFPDE